MGAMSLSHWLIVLVVVLLFFGPSKLGKIGSSLGEGIRGLRDGLQGKEPPGDTPQAAKPKTKSNDDV